MDKKDLMVLGCIGLVGVQVAGETHELISAITRPAGGVLDGQVQAWMPHANESSSSYTTTVQLRMPVAQVSSTASAAIAGVPPLIWPRST